MFPDTNSEWEGYASIIDGIRNPYVHLIAANGGVINLLVTGEGAPVGGYGVLAPVLLHWVVDEFEYSVTAHGLPTLMYDGMTYLRRARQSKLLQAYGGEILSVMRPRVQHFAFVGGEDCVELVTDGDLSFFPLLSFEARDAWIGEVLDQVRATFKI